MPEQNDTKQKIMEEFHLDETHNVWQPEIDNWFSVEAFRMQKGRLPNQTETTEDMLKVMMDFLRNRKLHFKLLKQRGNEFGSMFLSAKRFLRTHLDRIIL